MPFLGPDDPLPGPVRRILVGGGSGAGKTTLCRQLATLTGLPRTELDSLYHGENWVPRESFVADVERFTAGPAWVIEWQYGAVKPMLARRAELFVFLDHPRWLVMWRVSWRTLLRRLHREELWNGNREQPLWRILTDHDHVVRWAWRAYGKYATQIPALLTDPDGEHLVMVRVRGQRQLDQWLAGPFRAALAPTESEREESPSAQPAQARAPRSHPTPD